MTDLTTQPSICCLTCHCALVSVAICLTHTDPLQIYKESRTLIIEKYRESPKQRLEFPAVKEAVAKSGISTDYEGLRRIYDFLDAWGLINYEASDGAGHSLGSLPPVVAASGVPSSCFMVPGAIKRPCRRQAAHVANSSRDIQPGSCEGFCA